MGDETIASWRPAICDRCKDCKWWKPSVITPSFKADAWCGRHFRSQEADDVACNDFQAKEARDG